MQKSLLLLLSVCSCVAFAADITFFNAKMAPKLHGAADRKQQLVFVPSAPGSESGVWRIEFSEKAKIGELLMRKEIPLPAFEKELKIEMDMEATPNANVVGADLRLKDAQYETCVFKGVRGVKNGKFTAVWTITPGAKVKFSWGGKANKILDLPAKITNIAIVLHKAGKHDVTLKAMRFVIDGKTAEK